MTPLAASTLPSHLVAQILFVQATALGLYVLIQEAFHYGLHFCCVISEIILQLELEESDFQGLLFH